MDYQIIKITDRPEIIEEAAEWFNSKWGVPTKTYIDSMKESLLENKVPRWYLVMDGDRIIGGCGVIENDFHNRPDLAPNLCALYVEEDCRGLGIAGRLMDFVCLDLAHRGINALFLVTDHTSFYERYGWEFFVMVKNSDGESESRLYRRKIKISNYIPDVGEGEIKIKVYVGSTVSQINDNGEAEHFLIMRDSEKRFYIHSITYEQSNDLFWVSEGTITIKNGDLVCLEYDPPSMDDIDISIYDPGCLGAL